MTAEEAIGVIGFYMASDSISQEERERKAIRALNAYANTRALQIAEKAVGEEPELPGDMPDEMWEAIKSDRQVMRESFRIAVRQTKHGILSRIKGETGGE